MRPFSDPSTATVLPEQSFGSRQDELLSDDFSRIVRVLSHAVRQASELRRFADDARRANDAELHAFFERCAFAQLERATEAERLLVARASFPRGEAVTAAAFAAGDGATDADVAPGSERRSVRVWPAQ